MGIKDFIEPNSNSDTKHLYEVLIEKGYSNDSNMADLVKTLLLTKFELIAQMASLEELLLEKNIITQEELSKVIDDKHIKEIVSKLQNNFDQQLLSSTNDKEV